MQYSRIIKPDVRQQMEMLFLLDIAGPLCKAALASRSPVAHMQSPESPDQVGCKGGRTNLLHLVVCSQVSLVVGHCEIGGGTSPTEPNQGPVIHHCRLLLTLKQPQVQMAGAWDANPGLPPACTGPLFSI